MKIKNIHSRKIIPALLMALALCLMALPVTRADSDPDRSIVGMWHVEYYSGGSFLFQTYDQWHSDGLEFEINSIAPGAVCNGIFRQEGDKVHLFHEIFTYDSNGQVNGHIDERQENTVSPNGLRYSGTFDNKAYDLNGKFVGDQKGTLTATRIVVH